MNNRAFSKIGVLIILVILITGGILVWQYFGAPEKAEDETADWETYQIPQLGFSIKFPPGTHVSEVKCPGEHGYMLDYCFIYFSLPGDYFPDGGSRSISIESWTKFSERSPGKISSLQDVINWRKKVLLGGEYIYDFKNELINLSGVSATKFSYIDKIDYPPEERRHVLQIDIMAQYKERMYSIEGGINFEYKDAYLLIFNQMLSTFKLIEAEESYIKVISPNGGEKWVIGNIYQIKWQSSGIENVNIVLHPAGARPKTQTCRDDLVNRNIPASQGESSFTLPANMCPRDDYMVAIYTALDFGHTATEPSDTSDNYFTIVK